MFDAVFSSRNDAKTVNVITTACFSKVTKVSCRAVQKRTEVELGASGGNGYHFYVIP